MRRIISVFAVAWVMAAINVGHGNVGFRWF